MKKHLVLSAITAASLLTQASAVSLVWNFTDDNTVVDLIDGGAANPTPNFTVGAFALGNSLGTVSDSVNTTSPSSYTGASGTGNLGNAVKVGALDISTSSYYTFTLTPAAGYAISLTDFDFGTRSTATGPAAYALYSSADSFATPITSGVIANNSTWTFKDNTFTAFSGPADASVEFRLYTYGGTGNASAGTQNSRVDDITVSASAVAVPEPATALTLVSGLGFLGLVRRRSALLN